MKLTIVVGTRNEKRNIAALVAGVTTAVEGLSVEAWEMLFADDSDDDTPDVIEKLAERGHPLRVLHRPPDERRDGLSGALVEAFAATAADVVVVMDADLQHPPETIPTLVQPILDSAADLVVGSRYLPGGDGSGLGGPWRRFLSRTSGELVRVMFPEARGATDPGGNFFAMHRSVIENVDLKPMGFKMLVDILVRGHATHLVEVPYTFAGRNEGQSKFGPRVCLLFLGHVAKLYRDTRWGAGQPARVAPQPAMDHEGLRILMVASEAPPMVSGVARSVGRLVSGLRERGHAVELVSFVDMRRWSVGEFRVSAFPFHAARMRGRLANYDAVVLHGPVPTLSDAFLLAWRSLGAARPPLVYTHHYSIEVAGAGVLCVAYNRAHQRMAHLADQVVVTTESYRHQLTAAGSAPVDVIPWGVDPGAHPARDRRDGGRLRVLYVGQLRPYKGVQHLVDAAAGVPSLDVTIAGSGPLAGRLQARAMDATNVRFVDSPSDAEVAELFRSHDVVVLPSINRLEAFGIALVEGMAAGCVPIASDLPGLRDVASPTGIVTPVGDAAALRTALVHLAADPDRLLRLSDASVLRARELSWERTVTAYDRLLGRITGVRVPPPQYQQS